MYICIEFHIELDMQINSRLTSFKCNLRQVKPFALSLVIILVASVAICSCGDNSNGIEITDAKSALKAHKAFLVKTSQMKETDIKHLVALTKEWEVLSDTLRNHIQPDTVSHPVYGRLVYEDLQDSIVNRLENIVDAEVRSFEDVVVVRDALFDQPVDSMFRATSIEVQKFFDTLDMAQVPEQSKEEALASYSSLIKSYLDKGIKSKADIQRFIRSEDIVFRSFLVHLHELGTTPLKNLTVSTEKVCGLVFQSGANDQMPPETPLVYMFMRTNRRVIQNAMTCLADINDGRVTAKSEQAIVYQWMMMKPFFIMDELSLSLLSDKQKEDVRKLAHELPSAAAKLQRGMGWSPLPMEEIPNEIIKELVISR